MAGTAAAAIRTGGGSCAIGAVEADGSFQRMEESGDGASTFGIAARGASWGADAAAMLRVVGAPAS
ncbi:MAG: hypothetical protein ABW175_05245, partial [Bradyrhizobium sp.]